MRKIVQICATHGGTKIDDHEEVEMDALFALCSDGSVWMMDAPFPKAEWHLLPAIPQGDLQLHREEGEA